MTNTSQKNISLIKPITKTELSSLLAGKKSVVSVEILGTDMVFTLDDGSTIVVDVTSFLADVFMDTATYNTATQGIDIVMTDGSSIFIPMADLLLSNTGANIDGDGGNNPLTVKLSSDAGNAVVSGSDGGIFVPTLSSGSGDMNKLVYDTDNSGVVDNSEKVNNLSVETSVPLGAVFTDTVYDDTSLQTQVSSNATAIAGKSNNGHSHVVSDITDLPPEFLHKNTIAWCFNNSQQNFKNYEVKMLTSTSPDGKAESPQVTISSGDFTINVDGVYKFTYKLNFRDEYGGHENVNTYAKKNGVILPETHCYTYCYTYIRNNIDVNGTGTFHGARFFQAGDVVNFWMKNNSGNTVALIANDSFMQVEYCPTTDLA